MLSLHERQKLDRRRVEDGYFQYALLKAASWYPGKFSLEDLPLHSSTVKTVALFTKIYHGVFMDKYSGDTTHLVFY